MLRDSEPLNVLARTLPQLLAQHGIEQDAYEVRRKRCIIASGCEQPASPVSNHLGQARRLYAATGTPSAIASAAEYPNASRRHSITATSLAASTSGISER